MSYDEWMIFAVHQRFLEQENRLHQVIQFLVNSGLELETKIYNRNDCMWWFCFLLIFFQAFKKLGGNKKTITAQELTQGIFFKLAKFPCVSD